MCALVTIVGAAAWRSSLRAEGASHSAPLGASRLTGDLARWYVLFGNARIAPTLDIGRAGSAQAFAFVNRAAGTAHAIVVYLDRRSRGRRLVVGLYEGRRHPGNRLTFGALSMPRAGAWNVIRVAGTSLSAGRRYWIAVLGQAGTLGLREITGRVCNGQGSYRGLSAGLPTEWRRAPRRQGCRLSAYALGTRSRPAPPANAAVPLYGSQGGPFSSALHVWPGQNWQPYAASSWANTQLPSWETASLYSDSANVIAYMSAKWAGHWTPWSFSNAPSNDDSSGWGHPLYFATSSDPLYKIKSAECAVGYGLATFCPTEIRLPNGARHASGSDGHLEVVEPAGFYSAAGTDPHGQPAGAVDEVDFYEVSNANPLSGGGTISSSGDGGLDFNGSGCCGYSTAMNQGLAGLMVRSQDLASRTINHALGGSFQCSGGSIETVVTPWPLSSGTGGACGAGGDGPPVGGRLQLKMDDSTIDGLNIPAWEKIVYKALAHYGIYVTDTGGSPMDPEFEPAVDYTSFGNTSNTLMSYFETRGLADPYSVTITIPWSDFQVVSPCYARGTC